MVDERRRRVAHTRPRIRRRFSRAELPPRWQAIIAEAEARQRQTGFPILLTYGPITVAKELLRIGQRADFTIADVEQTMASREVTPLVIALLLARDQREVEQQARAERSKRAQEIASRPRKAKNWDATRLLEFKADYVQKHGTARSWLKRASAKSGLSEKQIQRRIKKVAT